MVTSFTTLAGGHAYAQKTPVYAEAGLGFGQTLFFKGTAASVKEAFGADFNPGTGNNLQAAFYVAPECWRGLGLGARIHGTFVGSVKGKEAADAAEYIFNY